mmetsp:Transcript_23750/g.73118  ORF Transcript_23750/g.73118 Transcript_23750/m.73118 type:complete len:201 (-) Transcript_23750:111-713(-)
MRAEAMPRRRYCASTASLRNLKASGSSDSTPTGVLSLVWPARPQDALAEVACRSRVNAAHVDRTTPEEDRGGRVSHDAAARHVRGEGLEDLGGGEDEQAQRQGGLGGGELLRDEREDDGGDGLDLVGGTEDGNTARPWRATTAGQLRPPPTSPTARTSPREAASPGPRGQQRPRRSLSRLSTCSARPRHRKPPAPGIPRT